ncbi:MAG: DNA ligase [Chloroflexi bacterium]|nr:MAG: DNA ligase [Chloroflexota bacterium]
MTAQRGPQLEEYRRRRDFGHTSEPKGGRRPRTGARPAFVVQKHDASRLHYDLRLEVDGVLASWAVPRGPSTDPRDKRLAMRTEDHPLEYRDFEGVIPEGEYGAGSVVVWDEGTYRNLTERDGHEVPPGEGLAAGHLSIWIEGRKLSGGYALTRLRRPGREAWLLVKRADEAADPARDPVAEQPESVLTGRTVEEVAAGRRSRRSRAR